jgi:hypothetical protein
LEGMPDPTPASRENGYPTPYRKLHCVSSARESLKRPAEGQERLRYRPLTVECDEVSRSYLRLRVSSQQRYAGREVRMRDPFILVTVGFCRCARIAGYKQGIEDEIQTRVERLVGVAREFILELPRQTSFASGHRQFGKSTGSCIGIISSRH